MSHSNERDWESTAEEENEVDCELVSVNIIFGLLMLKIRESLTDIFIINVSKWFSECECETSYDLWPVVDGEGQVVSGSWESISSSPHCWAGEVPGGESSAPCNLGKHSRVISVLKYKNLSSIYYFTTVTLTTSSLHLQLFLKLKLQC